MFDSFIENASDKWGVPVSWINAVIQTESSFNPSAINSGGDRGLMQISPPTARAYGVNDLQRLFEPAYNIDIGTHLLHDLIESYGNDFQRVYSAYNSGKPDLYRTSVEVAANVQRAVQNLAQWAVSNPADSGALLAIAAVVAFILMRKK